MAALYLTQLKEVFTTTDVAAFKALYAMFLNESDDDVNTLLSFYDTYLHSYDNCIFFTSYAEMDGAAAYKLYG